MVSNYYNFSTTISNWYEVWQRIYDIPIKYQLPYLWSGDVEIAGKFDFGQKEQTEMYIAMINKVKREYCLFDIQEIVIITDKRARIMNVTDNHYSFVLLQYLLVHVNPWKLDKLEITHSIISWPLAMHKEDGIKNWKKDMEMYSDELKLFCGRFRHWRRYRSHGYKRIAYHVDRYYYKYLRMRYKRKQYELTYEAFYEIRSFWHLNQANIWNHKALEIDSKICLNIQNL